MNTVPYDMSDRLSRTVVIGVGEAGIDVLTALAAGDGLGWGTEYDNRFEYIAIAADPATLQRAPTDTTEVRLPVASNAFANARSTHPYLLRVHSAETDGVGRHRSVGRYALDSRDRDPRTNLHDALKGVLNALLKRTDDSRPPSCNVVHVHSMEDGIGSGSFPLVAYTIDEVTSDLRERCGMSINTTGVGFVPEPVHGVGSGFESVVPPAERWRYANTYAALRDIEKVTLANFDDPLPVYFHGERDQYGDQPFVAEESLPEGRIDHSPYNHYFLVGNDMRGTDGAGDGVETHTNRIREVVAAIYGIAALGQRIHSWLPPPAGMAHFGSFGQAQLSLPTAQIRRYCRLTNRVRNLKGQVDATDASGNTRQQTDNPVGTFVELRARLVAAWAEREAVIERLTTPQYNAHTGQLALDEGMVRRELDREALRTELTSLSAFHEAGYLARDLQVVMESRIPLASAWQSPLLTWSETTGTGTVGDHYGGRREVWMLHSEENTTLPEVDRHGAGQHVFRRSGTGAPFPPFGDPYTIQFLTYCIDAPLSDLKLYAELDGAAGDQLNALLKIQNDYRSSFAYPEWYGRDIRQYFGIRTRVELPRPPELDLNIIQIERSGEKLVAWVSSHGLASYLWLADEWDRYQGYITTHGTDIVGWRAKLAAHGLTYQDLRAVIPNGEPVRRWVAGELSWDKLLSRITNRLAEQEGISVAFAGSD